MLSVSGLVIFGSPGLCFPVARKPNITISFTDPVNGSAGRAW